ncbi:hypothetical protein RA29_09715 [Tateyamaria sp. ANG-S1]|nr:hypothetical protein RA29_09715 [Tateyamaria sp. ANG-S1]
MPVFHLCVRDMRTGPKHLMVRARVRGMKGGVLPYSGRMCLLPRPAGRYADMRVGLPGAICMAG